MGNHGIGQRNNNGERLCEFCDTNQLVISGTLFNHKNIHKATWNTPDGAISNQIDHTLVKRKFKISVIDTWVLRSADIGSDHNLVRTTIKLKLAKTKKDKNSSSRIRFDLAKLKRDDIKKKFVLSLKNKYEALGNLNEEPEDEIETECLIMEKSFIETAKSVLGKKNKRKRPWISEESWTLIEQRNELNTKMLGTQTLYKNQRMPKKSIHRKR